LTDDPDERWRSIPGRVFTASGRMFPATLARHPEDSTGPAVWVESTFYGPHDLIENERIVGFSAADGSAHDLIGLFNTEARRTR
jgi:hypothetical protein